MEITRFTSGEQWFEHFPVMEKLSGEKKEDVLLVDVGGGVGHELISLKKRFPDLEGRLVVQDIPVYITSP